MKKDSRLSGIISILSLLFSVLSIALNIFPQINIFSNDIIKMAYANDINSQLTLAHHYFSVHNYSDSIYWYEMLYSNPKNPYITLTLNNLACAKYRLSMEKGVTEDSFYENIYGILDIINEEDINVIRSKCRLLALTNQYNYSTYQYSEEKSKIMNLLYTTWSSYKESIETMMKLEKEWHFAKEEIMLVPYVDFNDMKANNRLSFINENNGFYYIYRGYSAVNIGKASNDKYTYLFEVIYDVFKNNTEMSCPITYITPNEIRIL